MGKICWPSHFLSLELLAIVVFISSLTQTITPFEEALLGGKVVSLYVDISIRGGMIHNYIPAQDATKNVQTEGAWTRIYNATTNHLSPSHQVNASPILRSDYGADIVVDQSGNLYVTGGWHSSPFGPFWAREMAFNFFVAKTDPQGIGVWFREISSGLNREDRGISLSLDADGNVYTLGRSAKPVSDNEGVVSTHEHLYFVAKYDNDGEQQWLTWVDGNTYVGVDLVTGKNGDSFVLGHVAQKNNSHNASLSWVLLKKYNKLGEMLWEQGVGVDSKKSTEINALANAISIDETGALYVAVSIADDDRNAKDNETDTLVTKLNHRGRQIWQRNYGVLGRDYPTAIAYNAAAGQVVMAGYSPGSVPSDASGNKAKYDFVSALSPGNGEPVWIVNLGAEEGGLLYTAIATDGFGDVHLTGRYGKNGTTKFGLGNAILYARVTRHGRLVHVRHMGTKNTRDHGNGIAVDNRGNFYITGSTGGNLNGVPSDASLLASDLFISKNTPFKE